MQEKCVGAMETISMYQYNEKNISSEPTLNEPKKFRSYKFPGGYSTSWQKKEKRD